MPNPIEMLGARLLLEAVTGTQDAAAAAAAASFAASMLSLVHDDAEAAEILDRCGES